MNEYFPRGREKRVESRERRVFSFLISHFSFLIRFHLWGFSKEI